MIRDERAAERIARLVPDSTDGLTAARALEALTELLKTDTDRSSRAAAERALRDLNRRI